MVEAATANTHAVEDMNPVVVADNVNPPPGEAPAQHQRQPEPDPAPSEPTPVVDPRDAIAERAMQRRMAEEAKFSPKDTNFVPPSIAYGQEDDDPPDDGQQNRNPEGAAREAALSDSEGQQQPQAYYAKLKVNGVEIPVSRDQLLQYADLLDEEAKGIPDRALIKLAQQNIAAQDILERAKEIRRSAQLDAARGVSNPGEATDPEPAANQPQHTSPKQDHLTAKDVAESIQFDDPEVAAEKLERLLQDKVEQARQVEYNQQRLAAIGSEVDQAIAAFARANPDLASDQVATDALTKQVERETLQELAKCGLTQEQLDGLQRNPHLIGPAYIHAVKDGYEIRKPAEIFAAVGSRVRQSLGRPAPASQPQATSRDAAKQNLTQQPNRGGPVPQQSHADAEAGGRYKDAIAAMRRARGQSV